MRWRNNCTTSVIVGMWQEILSTPHVYHTFATAPLIKATTFLCSRWVWSYVVNSVSKLMILFWKLRRTTIMVHEIQVILSWWLTKLALLSTTEQKSMEFFVFRHRLQPSQPPNELYVDNQFCFLWVVCHQKIQCHNWSWLIIAEI